MQEARCRTKRPMILKMSAFLLILAVLLLLASAALAQGNHDLAWRVIAGGSGRMASAGHTLMGTAGQPFGGTMSLSSSPALCSGFWCGAIAQYHVYLPLTIKN